MINPVRRDLTLYRTTDYYETINFAAWDNTPLNIGSYTFTMAARKAQLLSSSPVFSITNTTGSGDGIKIIDAANGVATFKISQSTIQALPTNVLYTSDEYTETQYDYFYYDVKVVIGGISYVYIYGVIKLYSGISV